jgi:YHS domain-containing protein/plastocyanin
MTRFRIVLAIMTAGMALLGAPAHAHDVKDPVCRMMVDSDTAKFKHRLGSKTFYFCSQRCQDSFVRSPEKYEKLAEQLEKQDLHDYRVELTVARPAVVAQPVELTFAIRYADTNELVKQFEVVHERLLHVVMVTGDLSWFEHQHPERGQDGLFHLTWTFPRPGQYRLYTDFTPADGDNQVKQLSLTVGGTSPVARPLVPDCERIKQVGDYQVELRVDPAPLRMERATLLTYVFRDRRRRPIRDMQPFIGAAGHLFAISEDGKQWVHTHNLHVTAEAPADHAGLRVTPAIATESGPAFSFKLTLPTGGLYKTWAQFMRRNRVVTVPFTFQVADLWETADRGSKPQPGAKRPEIQRATIVINGQYQPATVTIRAGRPVELTFVRQEASGCGDVVQFPSLGVKRTLKTGEKAVVSFTPSKPGTVPFTCGMSMYRGQVVVK